MCGCNSSKMKKKKIGKYGVERLLAVGAGALGGVLINNVVKNYTDGMDEEKKVTFSKVWPVVKIVGGGYMVMQKNQMVSDAGLGVVAEGAVEAALVFAPNQFQLSGLAGFWGEDSHYYSDIGSAYQSLPLDAASSRLLEEPVADTHGVMGYNYRAGEGVGMSVM